MDLSRAVFPLLQRLDPERAHNFTIWALRNGFGPERNGADDPRLHQSLWGLKFPNPIGISAGFDKNAEVFDPLLRAGFGFVEVGTVTPRPQLGNPKPRLFRLPEDGALINRMGFNNDGLDPVIARLSNRHGGVVGVNIGINRDCTDAERDYALAAGRLAPLADYLVINVSSPNTPGLRALQDKAALQGLIRRTQTALRDSVPTPPPMLVKIAPDLTEDDERDIADVAMTLGLQGLIVSNTTIDRADSLASPHCGEGGGLSGRPLFERSTALLGRLYRMTEGTLPIIGVGGVCTAQDAYAKIRAGASLVQLYSALALQGPTLLPEILDELGNLLTLDGFESVTDAVGAAHR